MFINLVNAYIAGPKHRGKRKIMKQLLRLAGNRPVRSRYGVNMIARPEDYTNFASVTGLFPGDYNDVFRAVSGIPPGSAFLDIGANAGVFSLVAASRVGIDGVVVSFEPSHSVFRDLVDNCHANGFTNVFAFNAAFGAPPGVERFVIAEPSHTGVARLSDEGSGKVLVFDYHTLSPVLDPLIGEREINIKIDVEGAEYRVLQGLLPLFERGNIKCVVVEIDPGHLARFASSATAIYDMMAGFGFSHRRGIGAAEHYNEVFYRS